MRTRQCIRCCRSSLPVDLLGPDDDVCVSEVFHNLCLASSRLRCPPISQSCGTTTQDSVAVTILAVAIRILY